jgi:putative ABC transport system permease protein
MLWFRVRQTLILGIKSLWMHRLRSTLTMLGIVFGVCSVIAMLAIGEGASQAAQESIAQLGSRNIIIETVKPPQEQAATSTVEMIRSYGLTYVDAESIHNTIPDVEVIVPVRLVDQEARYGTRRVAVKVVGTVPWYTDIAAVQVIRGRFLSSIDLLHQQAICVLDERVAEKLFAFDDPIGQDIAVQQDVYCVVGLLAAPQVQEQKTLGMTAASGAVPGGVAGNIYIPLTTARTRFGDISVQLTGGSRIGEKVELQKITVKVSLEQQVLPMRDILDSLLRRRHEKKDYQIVVPLELLQQAARTRRIFSIVLGSIAAISLVVGGIGIMNIMLATVSERTREIGIRRALGARRRDIIIQFLSETVLLTLLGGAFGIILGLLIPYLVQRLGHMPTVITPGSLVLSFGISAAVGVTFGLYPAYRAAHVDPIESLRHE